MRERGLSTAGPHGPEPTHQSTVLNKKFLNEKNLGKEAGKNSGLCGMQTGGDKTPGTKAGKQARPADRQKSKAASSPSFVYF